MPIEKFFQKQGSTIITGFVSGLLGALLILELANPGTGLRLIKSPKAMPSAAPQNGVVAPLSDQEALVEKVVSSASPAVVSIIISKDVPVIEQYWQQMPGWPFGGGNDFGPFGFSLPQYRQNGTQKQEVGGGSGFLISNDGMIVTNKHVVSQTDAEYTVFTNDGTKYDAQVVARDPMNDIAIIKIKATNTPSLQFANSDQLKVGQSTIAIGNALGEFRNTVSVGVVSGLSRSIVAGDSTSGAAEQIDQVIQTDAAINPGNSGGPLLDLSGTVIGVNVAMAQGGSNIGFALPANLVKSVVDSVKTSGKIIRPFLGVRYTLITPALKQSKNLSVDYGALIVRGDNSEPAVVSGSPADKAGLRENDIILEVNGTKIDSQHTLAALVQQKKVGDKMTLKVKHNDAENTVTVTLEEAS